MSYDQSMIVLLCALPFLGFAALTTFVPFDRLQFCWRTMVVCGALGVVALMVLLGIFFGFLGTIFFGLSLVTMRYTIIRSRVIANFKVSWERTKGDFIGGTIKNQG